MPNKECGDDELLVGEGPSSYARRDMKDRMMLRPGEGKVRSAEVSVVVLVVDSSENSGVTCKGAEGVVKIEILWN